MKLEKNLKFHSSKNPIAICNVDINKIMTIADACACGKNRMADAKSFNGYMDNK